MDIAKKLHPLERKVIPFLKNGINVDEIILLSGLKHIEVTRAVQWLENKDLVKLDKKQLEILDLDKNGLNYKKNGIPEKKFLESIKKESLKLSEINKKSGLDRQEINISIGLLRRQKLIETKKEDELIVTITNDGKNYLHNKSDIEKFLENTFPLDLSNLSQDENKLVKDLLSRKNFVKRDKKTIITINLTKTGEKVSKLKLSDEVIDKLDSKLLKTGDWKNKEFRSYDVEINVPKIHGGKRHFTNQVVDYIKTIWQDLGFQEMTGNICHTSFWDLDALFVPQDHPAREMQDTFYLKEPVAKGQLPDKKLVNAVKNTHENGWTTGSLGWRGPWSTEKAAVNLLRTHTTVLSAQTISKLKESDLPAKFFAVGKVFRNEALDWKHLFEFYQVEGIVVDPDANFSNLVGYLKNFFAKMGFPDVRIRPAHFPYTEPSAEVDVWHPVKKQWVELGGSGVFRPETVKPLLGKAVPVLAWGFGLGRMMSAYWGITDIRDLYKNDLKKLREMKVWDK
jgi:phenylalanyl-tRNA synthetase alpha chain